MNVIYKGILKMDPGAYLLQLKQKKLWLVLFVHVK